MLVGVVGKPNSGKSTFFSAATMVHVVIAPYPFTTIEPNHGIAHVRVQCVCREFQVKDNPKNSRCVDGVRYVPVELIDVAGLVPDAWKGRGLGNKFLDELRRADVLLHVVDASGGTDLEGKICKMGSHDPTEDVEFLQHEIVMWMFQILSKDWDKLAKSSEISGADFLSLLEQRVSGLSIERKKVITTIRKLGLNESRPTTWSQDDLMRFVETLRQESKPILIVANKADLPTSKDNIKRLQERFKSTPIIPCSAESELALKRAAEKGLVSYTQGSSSFEIINEKSLTSEQKSALHLIRERVLSEYSSTGVQTALEQASFSVLGTIAVFPVEDATSLSDHEGRVLPDVYLVPAPISAREFAYKIHTELGETFISAIDARSKQRIGEAHSLKHRDVIRIVAAKGLK